MLAGEVYLNEERQLGGAWEDRRIRAEERHAAEKRMGEEWARQLVIDAKKRAQAASEAVRVAKLTPTQLVLAQRRADRKRRRAA